MAKKPQQRRNPDDYRERLSQAELTGMLAILIRDKEAHAAVRDYLTTDVVDKLLDGGARFVWRLVGDHYEKHDALSRKTLKKMVEGRLERRSGEFIDEELATIDALLAEAGDGDVGPADVKAAGAAAKQAVEEYHALTATSEILVGDMVHKDAEAALQEKIDELRRIKDLESPPVGVTLPAGWLDADAPDLYSTGVPVLDKFLGGGHTGGEVYMFMAPLGTCKTLLAVLGVAKGARHARTLYAQAGGKGPVPVAVLVSYETAPEELQRRVASCAARVDNKRIAAVKRGEATLSTAENLEDYEQEMFAARLQAGLKVKGEQERIAAAETWINRHTLFLDMTGESRPGVGTGFVAELARELKRVLQPCELRPHGAYPVVVWVDHLSAMLRRYKPTRDLDAGARRKLVIDAAGDLAGEVAKPFRCPVWLNHQLSGEANDRPPGARIDHTDASEAKLAAEYAAFAIVVGRQDEAGRCRIQCTKHRRENPQSYRVIQIEGAVGRIRDVTRDFTVDAHGRGIVSRDEYEGMRIMRFPSGGPMDVAGELA